MRSLAFLLLVGCAPSAFTLQQAAKTEVFTTASCASLDVSHVAPDDVAARRDDVYTAEGCGQRWRMTCESKYVSICKRRSRHCRTRLVWSCENIQPDGDPTSDDDLRARVVHDDPSFLKHS